MPPVSLPPLESFEAFRAWWHDNDLPEVLYEAFRALAEDRERWQELAEARDDLLVCYRLGKPNAEKALRRLERAQAARTASRQANRDS